MILRVLVVVPYYNNERTLSRVVQSILDESPFDVLVIDDGSSTAAQELVRVNPRLEIIRHPRNRGKGMALQTGLKRALERGFTHVISSDADGQHGARDINLLAEAALKNPWALIIGARTWPESGVPRSSRFGRKFSNFWVWHETGVTLSDTQSGFRVYPLFCLQTIRFFCQRFDFEIEVLVRHIWRSFAIIEVPVGVVYNVAEGRVSHFHKFFDNVRITLLHIVLITIGLFRRHFYGFRVSIAILLAGLMTSALGPIPALFLSIVFAPLFFLNGFALLIGFAWGLVNWLGYWSSEWGAVLSALGISLSLGLLLPLYLHRKSKRKTEVWSGKVRGGRFGNEILASVTKRIGLYGAYFCMFFVVPYFILAAPRARRASAEFWRVVRPDWGALNRAFAVVRHFFIYSTLLLDRLFQSHFAKAKFSFLAEGAEYLRPLLREKPGLVLVGAHFGSLQHASRVLDSYGYSMRVLRAEYVAEGLSVKEILKKTGDAHEERTILRAEESSPLMFRELIEKGSSITFLADRPMSRHYELVPFFGKLIAVDTIAMRVADAANVELLFVAGVKTAAKKYCFIADRGDDPSDASFEPAKRVYQQALRYAQFLERVVGRYPMQWGNLYSYFSTLPAAPGKDLVAHVRGRF